MTAPWITTASGRKWSLTEPCGNHLHWPDVGASLAKICRWTGHPLYLYSVAEHCCRVADLLPPEWRPYGLLHDAHEFALGDISSPLPAALRTLGAGDALRTLAAAQDKVIYMQAGLVYPLPEAVAAAVKQADEILLATENRDIMPEGPTWSRDLPAPNNKRIKPWPWPKAEAAWLDHLYDWCPATRTLGVD